MAPQPMPNPNQSRSAAEIVREVREQNARSRERVLRGIERLREIAEAQRRAARRG